MADEASIIIILLASYALQGLKVLENPVGRPAAEELCKHLYKQKGPQILLDGKCWLIRLGINSRSSTKGCFSTAKDKNKMANTRKQFVFRSFRIILKWRRDVARIYLIQRKAIIDSFIVVPDIRL